MCKPPGVVGECYEPYQNANLFGFMERFCEAARPALETCCSLRGGRSV